MRVHGRKCEGLPQERMCKRSGIVVDFRLDTDPLLLRELPIGFGDGTGTQARPPLTPGNSAGLSVRNLTCERANPPGPGGDSSPLLARPLRTRVHV